MKISLGFSYILTLTGSLISMISGVFLGLIGIILRQDLVSNGSLSFLKPIEINPYASLAVIALSFIVITFCYYGKGKGFYGIGILAILVSLIILVIRGGFYIGPLISIVGGFLVYKNEKIVNPKEQYEYLAEFVNQVPSDINVYIMPGNHDTVRLAEPQPELSPAIRQMFTGKVTFLPNPYNLRIKKKLITLYHGMSLNDLIELIPGGNMNSVGKAIELMLKRRYMGPVYGGRTPIIPNQFDPHIFRDVPDIFITGHIHGHYLGNYNGVRYVNSSTWQSQTEYQKMMNYSPDPCIATLFDLNSKTVIKKNFLPKAFSE